MNPSFRRPTRIALVALTATTSLWNGFAAGSNPQVGNDDEYPGSVSGCPLGPKSCTLRFNLDGGQTFTLADPTGAGSSFGVDFGVQHLWLATATMAVVPGPAGPGVLAAGLALPGVVPRRRIGARRG